MLNGLVGVEAGAAAIDYALVAAVLAASLMALLGAVGGNLNRTCSA